MPVIVPYDRLLMKTAAKGADPRVVARVREYLLSRSQKVRVGGQLSEEVTVKSGVPQGSVLNPLLFLANVNDIWRNLETTTKLFADDCTTYRKIMNDSNIETVQIDLDRLGEWAGENETKINPGKSKAIRFTRARGDDSLNYYFGDQRIPEASS
jgi:hypothetical protein